MNNVIDENIIIFYFVIIFISLKMQNAKKNINEKNYQNRKKKIKAVNVDNSEEYVNEKIILQDVDYDDNIDLDGVDQAKSCIITSEFN